MQQFLIPSSTGSPQIINIPVSLLAQNGQQPISLITSNGQIFQLPVSQLVVQQNADGTTTTTSTQGVNQNVSGGGAGTTSSAASSSSATSTNATQLVINQQGQLISLPVIQTANTSQNNNLGNNVQAVNFVSLAGSNNNANTNGNNVSLQIINRSATNNNNTNTNGQTPIKSLLEDDDKSNTSLDDQGQTIAQMPITQATILNASGGISHTGTTVDGVNLDEIREFAKAFKLRRLALGLTQTQVGQALSATKGPAYSQSAICRFEKLDITPKSAAKIKPVLEKWMQEAELKYADSNLRLKTGAHHNFADLLGNENAKKRKRRTSFTPQALEVLNEYFEKNTHPSGNQGADMTMLAQKLNYDREVIRVWFCNKRQALKNTMKKIKSDNPNDILNSSQNSNHSINATSNNGLTSIDQDVNSSNQSNNANGGIGSTLNLLNASVVVNNQQTTNAANNAQQQQQAPTKTVITLTNDDLKLDSSNNNSNNNKNLNDLILNHINSNENNYSDLKIREIVKSE